MNMISRSKKRNYAQIVCIFFAVIPLVLAIGGCGEGEGGDDYYNLTITSTYGGSVTTPGESEFSYAANTTVELVAEPDDHHHFVNWTGDVDTIGNVAAAATNITMYESYSIIANFELDEGWYSITIASNYGGSVIEPGEGYLAFAVNTTVDLVAEPNQDYRFSKWTGDAHTIANVNAAATNVTMDSSYAITANFGWFDIVQVAGGPYQTVGLKSDGTVVAVGENVAGECNVGDWTDIIQVAAGGERTVGVRSDGTVLAVGWNNEGACNVGDWTGINQTSAGWAHTVGLKSDGTVVAVGGNYYGECDVDGWTNIVQIAVVYFHTVGLKTDGTVTAAGNNEFGQCNVGSWTDIIQVAAGYDHTVGLKSDGTVVAVGDNSWGQCNVVGWTDITQVAANGAHTVGLRVDGTAVTVGDNCDGQRDAAGWTDIVQVSDGTMHTIGLKSDGTAVAAGENFWGECNVGI